MTDPNDFLDGGRDAYFAEAGKLIIDKNMAYIGMLQRMFKIGFNRAARIMDQLADAGVVGPEEGTKPRKVLMTAEEFENYLENDGITSNRINNTGSSVSSSRRNQKATVYEDFSSEKQQTMVIYEKLQKKPSFSEKDSDIIKDAGNVLISKAEYDNPLDFVEDLCLHCHPQKTKLLLIDSMGILDLFSGLPHLLVPVVKEKEKSKVILNWVTREIQARTGEFLKYEARDVDAYNNKIAKLQYLEEDNKPSHMAHIIVLFRELKDITGDYEAFSKLESFLPYCNRFGVSIIAFSMYERKYLNLGNLESFLNVKNPEWGKHLFDGDHQSGEAKDISVVDGLSGLEFEEFCSALLKSNGFSNVSVTKASGDYGGDILAEKDRIRYIIQCKRYESSIGLQAVQEVIAGRSIYKAHVGAVLTNSFFTNQAKKLADDNNIILWDRNDLIQMLKKQTN